MPEITPWYRGFSGRIERKGGAGSSADSATYVSSGIAEVCCGHSDKAGRRNLA